MLKNEHSKKFWFRIFRTNRKWDTGECFWTNGEIVIFERQVPLYTKDKKISGTQLLSIVEWGLSTRTLPRGQYFLISYFAFYFYRCETIFLVVYTLDMQNFRFLNFFSCILDCIFFLSLHKVLKKCTLNSLFLLKIPYVLQNLHCHNWLLKCF